MAGSNARARLLLRFGADLFRRDDAPDEGVDEPRQLDGVTRQTFGQVEAGDLADERQRRDDNALNRLAGEDAFEAAHFNLSVIASDIPVFREVIGDDYQKFNPNDIGSISESIKQFLSLKIHPPLKLPNNYSFERMTKEIFTLYQRV